VSDITKTTDENVGWYVERTLNLVSQVKSQARGLRRYKRRVERLRRELESERNASEWKLIYAAQFALEYSVRRDCLCWDWRCGHLQKSVCIATVARAIEAYMKKSRDDAEESIKSTSPQRRDVPCPASDGESRS